MTTATAWRTPARVSTAGLSRVKILLERGGTYYGPMDLRYRPDIEVGAYGSGARPILSGYKLLNIAASWTLHATGVWKINLANTATHTGNTASSGDNIGFLLTDGTIRPAKKSTLAGLSTAWDFYSDATHLYVRAAANPTTLAADLRAAPAGDLIQFGSQSGVHVHDLEVTGSGTHGLQAANVTDGWVHDCEFHALGGSYLPGFGDGTVRYGNGVQHWIGCKRWIVEDNDISQVYDVAYTAQGVADAGASAWEDITVRNNNIQDVTQTFEFWSQSGGVVDAEGFVRILVTGNTCSNAGGSAFAAVRPETATLVHLLSYSWELPADIEITGNTFTGSAGAYRYSDAPTAGLNSHHNTISLAAGHKMQYQHTETIEQGAAWATAHATETGSTFVVL